MCSIKKVVPKTFTKFTGKKLGQSLSFNKAAGIRTVTLFKKETLAQAFSCEFCEIFKNTSFAENLRTTASEIRKAPIFPNLKMAVSVFISDKVDSFTNVLLRYPNNNMNNEHQKTSEFQVS